MNELLMHPMILPVIFPIIAGILCLILPKKINPFIAVLSSAFTIYLTWQLFRGVSATFDINYYLNLKVDKLSGIVLLAIPFFGFIVSLYSINYMKGKERIKEYYAYLLWTIGISIGAVLANNFLLFLCFWGFLAFTLYLMIGISGSDASSAAKKSFIIVGGSDAVLLLGIGIIWFISGTLRMDSVHIELSGTFSYVAFICLIIAAFAKAGAMPFHSWVPDFGEKAPASVSAFLPASLDKLLGIYLLARICLNIFVMNNSMNVFLMIMGAITIICAVMMALIQHDIKRLLSYHAVSQVGYMVLGIGTGNPIGIAGGLFHMFNNTLYKSALFLSAGSIDQKAQTTDLDKLGGLGRLMPITLGSFFIASMAISGIPPFNGFASKWMVYQGIIESAQYTNQLIWISCLCIAMFGSALTLASFVKVMHAAFLCKPSSEIKNKNITEVSITMWLPTLILAVICILFGVFAYRLPLQYFIFPVLSNIEFSGIWWAGSATAIIIAGIIFGIIIYFITTARKVRESETYIGGEILNEVYISGVAKEKPRNIEVTGTDFYKTIQNFPLLNSFYKTAEKKLFDIYDVGTKIVFYFTGILQKAHSGILPAYLTWVMVGFLAVLVFLLKFGVK